MGETASVTIEKVIRKGKKYQVFISLKEEPFIFTEDQIVQYRLIKNAVFSQLEWEQIVGNQSLGIILDKAMHYADFKPRTKQEVINYLNQMHIEEEQIQKVIVRLEQLAFINDQRYAIRFIETGIANFRGPLLLKYQLEQKGIKCSFIEQAMIIYSTDIEQACAYQVAHKYHRLVEKYPVRKQKAALYQKLTREGFQQYFIERAISSCQFSSDSLEELQQEYEKLRFKYQDQTQIIQKLLQKGYQYSDIKRVVSARD